MTPGGEIISDSRAKTWHHGRPVRCEPASATQIQGSLVAKPNYQFEKRQRDLAKKAKQEEKRQQKLASKSLSDSDEEPAEAASQATGSATTAAS